MKGKLIIIGGHEDSEGDQVILKEVAHHALKDGCLVIVTAATAEPEQTAQEYMAIFKRLGVRNIRVLDIRTREDAQDEGHVKLLDGATVIFFTGGDQLRITSQIGDSPTYLRMQELYEKGTVIAGTSAGAAVMPTTMLISGAGDESSHISALGMAPGLGFIETVVIDSHFAERGRIGRLLGAVAQNPANLGVSIDEDTAIIVERNNRFRVIGSGAVYVVDGATMTFSSLSEQTSEGILSIFDVRLHVLGSGDSFDIASREPTSGEMEKER
jgi:cyanophycinase